MASQVRIIHAIECDVAAFWSNFLDDDFHHNLFVRQLDYSVYRLLERTDQGNIVRRRIEIMLKVDMPAAVAKVLGDKFSYCEAGEFDRATGIYHFSLVPPAGTPAGMANCGGVMRAEPAANGKTTRIIEISVEVHMFGLGGMLEPFALKAAQNIFDQQAPLLNRHLQGSS